MKKMIKKIFCPSALNRILLLEQSENFSLRWKSNSQAGQSLITLLFFMAIGVTVVTAAAIVVSADILTASNAQLGVSAYYVAEGGVENGVLYVLRNHPTTSVTLPFTNPHVTISYNSEVNTITSVGTDGTTSKTVSAQATFTNGTFTISNWREQ